MDESKKSSKSKKMISKNYEFKINDQHNQNNNKDKLLNYYSSLAKYHPDLIIVFSSDGEIVVFDHKKINSLFGKVIHNKEDIMKFLSEQNYKEFSALFYLALKGNPAEIEIELKVNDNNLFLHLTFIPIIIHENVEGIYLIVTNNTTKFLMKQELMLREKHLNYAQQIAEIGSWEYQIEEDKLLCSDNFYHIFGLDKDDFISMDTPFQLVHPHDYEYAYEKVKEAILNGTSYTSQLRIFHGKHKDLRYLKVHAEVYFEGNIPYKIIGVVKDDTYQIQLENQLMEQNENYQYIYDNLSSGIWMREKIGGKFIFASKGLEKILDIPVSKLYEDSTTWYAMIHPKYHQALEIGKKKLATGERLQTIYQLKSGSGKTKWLLEQVVPRISEHGQVTNIFGLVTDVTREMENEEKLTYLSHYDSLTGLPNQRSFFEKIDTFCEMDKPFALFYLDIDRFNIINDSLGYSIGDEALKSIAKRFEALLTENDYIARLSSDDFVMIVNNYQSKNKVYNLAETIINHINEPFIIQDYEIYSSTSIGITFFPDEGKDKLALLEKAQKALVHAKKEGKNCYQISSYLADISSYKKYVLDRDMRKAISNEEFELYLQPQVEPKSGLICSAEALIRWNHKEWGLVSPGEFIPLAEENHMINIITDWVIEEVCRLIKDWREKRLPIKRIAMNISPIRFMKKDLLQFLSEQLEKYQIDPNDLEFEITESTFLKSEKNVLMTIESLKQLGIRIAVDDFGTGYASLESIRKFKPNSIKIDRLFIQNMDKDPIDKGIISAALHLGKTLNMKVVAEGVEEIEQLDFLKQIDCDVIQGYLFSKPITVKQFEKLLAIGYLEPGEIAEKPIPVERRNYPRFDFHFPILGDMTIVELNHQQIQVGTTSILIGNIGLGGMKIKSNLKLPINMSMKFHFRFTLLNEKFEVDGELIWADEEYMGIFSYGVEFIQSKVIENRLTSVLNRISNLRKNNENITGTVFIYEDIHSFLGVNSNN